MVMMVAVPLKARSHAYKVAAVYFTYRKVLLIMTLNLSDRGRMAMEFRCSGVL